MSCLTKNKSISDKHKTLTKNPPTTLNEPRGWGQSQRPAVKTEASETSAHRRRFWSQRTESQRIYILHLTKSEWNVQRWWSFVPLWMSRTSWLCFWERLLLLGSLRWKRCFITDGKHSPECFGGSAVNTPLTRRKLSVEHGAARGTVNSLNYVILIRGSFEMWHNPTEKSKIVLMARVEVLWCRCSAALQFSFYPPSSNTGRHLCSAFTGRFHGDLLFFARAEPCSGSIKFTTVALGCRTDGLQNKSLNS